VKVYQNWMIALVLVLVLAAPLAIMAASLRGIANLAEVWDFRRFQSAASAAERGKLGEKAQRFSLEYLARHPGARRTLEIPPSQLLAGGPVKRLRDVKVSPKVRDIVRPHVGEGA